MEEKSLSDTSAKREDPTAGAALGPITFTRAKTTTVSRAAKIGTNCQGEIGRRSRFVVSPTAVLLEEGPSRTR